MRWVALLLLLSGCAAVPDGLRTCAARVPEPAPLPRVRTPEQLGQFAVRLELAREAERRRGDDCAGVVRALNEWMKERTP